MGKKKESVYHNANKVEFVEFVVLPTLSEFVLLLFVVTIEQACDRVKGGSGRKQKRHEHVEDDAGFNSYTN